MHDFGMIDDKEENGLDLTFWGIWQQTDDGKTRVVVYARCAFSV
jgi:hypothetical protein